MEIKVVENAVSVTGTDIENKSLSDSKREDLFIQLLLGQDATGEIETSRGSFTVKFPKEKDRLQIGRLMGINRCGIPATSFDIDTETRNLVCSTLNVVIVKGPEWLEAVKKKQNGFRFEEVPCDEFLIELYQKACEFRDQVQERLKAGTEELTGVSTGESAAPIVDNGIFDGLEGSAD
ncbi:hypothetical protein DWQ65_02355 [Treponema phagedenis]|uniref:Uncharacterized protein n=1 Tax=Treponema phagedenis TaxID=162 RepID=A0A0B7GSR8_TREPH|nr:hypothetical protein [Treponema phagedenis]QEJ95202.1 hypothetical protein FUT79_08325 [Treponema phagedenis]QSH98935.1 hypothetical protein DWQ65_02355 [Treponema phagedenis]CEM61689.1 conserved hypothetical protein [Treponema phagedenis]